MSIDLKKFKAAKRVLIIGDAGVGKTTVAKKLGQRLNLPVYSTDDALWSEKFTRHRDRDDADKMMGKIYKQETWIVEGTTRGLLKAGVFRSDIILFLGFRNIFTQYKLLIRRYIKQRDETIWNLIGLLLHVTKKRLSSKTPVLLQMIKNHSNVIIEYFPIQIVG